jgi:hypothetical protein
MLIIYTANIRQAQEEVVGQFQTDPLPGGLVETWLLPAEAGVPMMFMTGRGRRDQASLCCCSTGEILVGRGESHAGRIERSTIVRGIWNQKLVKLC